MTKLNLKQPYGVVYGHDTIRYTQDGKNFNVRGDVIPDVKDTPPTPKVQKSTEVVKATPLENAKAFLRQVLKENPLSKSVIYKEVENNNLDWNTVRDAAVALQIEKFTTKNLEMWKLPEGVQA